MWLDAYLNINKHIKYVKLSVVFDEMVKNSTKRFTFRLYKMIDKCYNCVINHCYWLIKSYLKTIDAGQL